MSSPTNNSGADSNKKAPKRRSPTAQKPAAASASNGKKSSTVTRKSAPKTTKAAAPTVKKSQGTPPPAPPTKKSTHWRRLFVLGSLAAVLLFGIWLVYLDAKVRAEFDGKKWALPAKVYARPLTLYPGKSLSAEQLRAELQWADYTRSSGASRVGSYDERGERWFIYRRAFPFWDGAEATRRLSVRIHDGHITELTDGQGDVALVRLEPQYIGGIFPAHNEDRELIKLSEAPAQLVAALIVTEDKAYFDHWGVSARGIARAMMANMRAGGMVQGGSTLTQQLVKNFFLTNERSLQRKIQEALMALLLERHYSKEEILQAYLNEVYLGQAGRRAIHGFGLASRFYFGKPLNELQTSEIAMLVGLVKGASFYNPRRNPERAKERRDLVLGLMEENGIISTAERIRAQGQSLETASPRRAGQREYPAFLELAKDQLQRNYRLADLQSEGLHIFTTLDPWVQHAVEDAAANQLSLLERRQPELRDQLETAAVITSVDGGEIRALLGSRKAEFFGFNRAIAAQRSIGSLAKPAVYLAALESGRYHWGSLLDDGPVTVAGPSEQLWQPKNYDHQSHGEVPMIDALARSYNQATARLGMQVGLQNVVAEFAKLGVEQPLPPYPSLLLGAISMSPLDVAHMYQTIASQGFVMPLRTIEAVTTASGETLSSYAIQGEQAYDPNMIQWLRYGLEQVAERGTAKALGQSFGVRLAAKTGTSDDQRDAWLAGFDNRHLGVIWVGRDDNQPMPYTGSSAALPIWRDTFKRVGVEPLLPASGLVNAAVDERGILLGDNCRGSIYPFLPDRLDSTAKPCEAAAQESKGKRSWLDWLF